MLNSVKYCRCDTLIRNFVWKSPLKYYSSRIKVPEPSRHLSMVLSTNKYYLPDTTSYMSKRFIQTSSGLTQDIRYKDYLKRIKEGMKIVDVRNPGEIKNMGGVSGSFEIPLDQLQKEFMLSSEEWKKKYKRGKPTEDSPVMLICASGVRSKAGVKVLKQLGYQQPLSYAGGYKMFKDKK